MHVVDAFDTDTLQRTLKEANALDEIVVIIAQSPCALLDTAPVKAPYMIDTEICTRCGMCMKPGCPAITKKIMEILLLMKLCVMVVDFVYNCADLVQSANNLILVI